MDVVARFYYYDKRLSNYNANYWTYIFYVTYTQLQPEVDGEIILFSMYIYVIFAWICACIY